jgi:peptidoglycan/LPS O-acetylase OafA/YrhL
MMMYLFAPAYMMLIRKHPVYRWLPVLMILWCIMVRWVGPINSSVGHIEIFWSRVPIFFIGINCGELVRRKVKIDGTAIWFLIITFIATFGSCIYLEQVTHGMFPLYVERMIYIPFTISSILLLNRVFRRTPKLFNRFCKLVGAISLEAYLIHIHFVLVNIQPYHLGYWPTALLTILITLPLAWILHKMIMMIENKLLVKKK